MEEPFNDRLMIVSNRLPVVLARAPTGNWQVRPGSGGLVTALAPVLRDRGGIWVGWPGTLAEEDAPLADLLNAAAADSGYALRAVTLEATERDEYYRGFANEIIWPLFHDLQSHCIFAPAYWQAYLRVNQRFAEAVARDCAEGDFLWVHDYHLMSVAHYLRRLKIRSKATFFLHIPFPPVDIFARLPWRFEILSHLLEYDLLGFQTPRDRMNFVQCVRRLARNVAVSGRRHRTIVRTPEREVRVGAFPISIDFDEFARGADTREVADTAWYVHEDLPQRQIILGIDRLDYTKGLIEKLRAYQILLRTHPEMREKITLLQIVVPSRFNIPKYLALKEDVERLVSEINGEYTRSGWVPIHYIYRHLQRRELLAYYRTAEVALVTPLKDGMNLVAKEYCAANLEENGVLILSEFAGAVAQLHRWALVVNPHDIEAVARALETALEMPLEERQRRMRRLRQSIRRHNIFAWVDSFLQAAIAKPLRTFPIVESYSPARRFPAPETPSPKTP